MTATKKAKQSAIDALPVEARLAKALAHPLRARLLRELTRKIASPGDLSVQLNKPLGVVSYHVRMLRDYGCVELVRIEPRRGALQHFYRAIVVPPSPDVLNGEKDPRVDAMLEVARRINGDVREDSGAGRDLLDVEADAEQLARLVLEVHGIGEDLEHLAAELAA